MAFGQKSGSLKNLKKSLAKGGGAGFIKFIPKNGSMNVRFIQEPEEWVNYVEHFDQMIRKSYPCSGEQSCPGCASGERKSSRYLANVVDLDDQNQRVVPLQMPKDLANRLVVKYEKWGSITDRDIELSRSGEGLDTVYDLDPSVVDRKSVAKYTPIDLLKVLEDAYENVFGGKDDEDEEDAPAPVVKGRRQSAAAKKAAAAAKDSTFEADEDDDSDDPDDSDDEEVVEKAPAPRKRAAAKKAAKEPEFKPDEDEDEDPDDADADDPDEDEDEDDEDDEEGFTQEDLEGMTLGVLRATARSFGVSTKGKSRAALIEEIMESGEEED